MKYDENMREREINVAIGSLVFMLSSGQSNCLRLLLPSILKVTSAISCCFAMYKPLYNSTHSPMIDLGKWYGVCEQSTPGIINYGYSNAPITEYLQGLNQGNVADGEYLKSIIEEGKTITIPVRMNINGASEKVVFVVQPLISNMLTVNKSDNLFLILLNPYVKTAWSHDSNGAFGEYIAPWATPAQIWLWWLSYQRSQFRDRCQRMLREGKKYEDVTKSLFRILIRLHTLDDIITFANIGLLLHQGDDNEGLQIQWLDEEVMRFIEPNGLTDHCWHDCLKEFCPPCHEGKLADRKLAKILLSFCPWTSGAQHSCPNIPNELRSEWDSTVRNRLWGWNPKISDSHYIEYEGVDPQFINAKSLTSLFSSEFFIEGMYSVYLDKNAKYITIEEKGRFMANVGRVLHYLLAKTPLDWSTIEGLVWMISEYGHTQLGIDPRLDISSHLLHAARAEPALHAMQAYYRDHFFHAIEVCFLGHLLLITQDKHGKYLWQHVAKSMQQARCSGKWPKDISDNNNDLPHTLKDVLRLWYVSALFHDVGYAIQIFSALQKMLGFYSHPEEMKAFKSDLENSLEKLSDAILKSDLTSVLKLKKADNPGEDHGVIAATHLKSLLSQLNEDNYPGNYYPAIRAIGIHNNRRETVEFQTDPLGFLLILCDTIQEWNRPHLRYTTAPSMLLARLMGKEEKIESTTGPLDRVSLNVTRSDKPNPRPKFQIEHGDILKICLSYDEQIQKDAGVFNLWIDSTCNLQRLQLNSLPFNIEITFRTPLFRLLGKDTESQMARLRDAAAETHMHLLHDWLPNTIDASHLAWNKTRAVRHSIDWVYEYEELTLDLRLLSEKKTIAGSIKQFRERLQTWKRWSEDRDFEGDYSPLIPGK